MALCQHLEPLLNLAHDNMVPEQLAGDLFLARQQHQVPQ
jgi:hypothetical protein